jgi:diadenylate cyclase
MDGAIIVNSAVAKITHANVQLMPDPTIPSSETGTRHRTAERVAKQTDALVISISQQRETVTVFVDKSRYQLDAIADVLAKTNQALATLETYRARLDQVLTRLTALEFQNAVMLGPRVQCVRVRQLGQFGHARRAIPLQSRGCAALSSDRDAR